MCFESSNGATLILYLFAEFMRDKGFFWLFRTHRLMIWKHVFPAEWIIDFCVRSWPFTFSVLFAFQNIHWLSRAVVFVLSELDQLKWRSNLRVQKAKTTFKINNHIQRDRWHSISMEPTKMWRKIPKQKGWPHKCNTKETTILDTTRYT